MICGPFVSPLIRLNSARIKKVTYTYLTYINQILCNHDNSEKYIEGGMRWMTNEEG